MDSDFVKIYAVYRGDSFLFVGTKEEVQERYRWSNAKFYRMYKRVRWDGNELELHYIGKEILPMYQRLRRTLITQRRRFLSLITSSKRKSATVSRWEGHVEQIDIILKLIDIMEKEDEEVRSLEEEGKYYV